MKRNRRLGIARRYISLLSMTGAGFLAAGLAIPTSAYANSPLPTGPKDAITDVPGVEVGQVTDHADATGTTVFVFPKGALVGANPSGGSPGDRMATLFMAGKQDLFYTPSNGIILNGGSSFGLDGACGLVNWLRQHGMGQKLFGTKYRVPQVPGAIIFDLTRGDDYHRTKQDVIPQTCSWGYRAAQAATDGPVREGSVGAGTGAESGGIKGGVGTASTSLGQGIYVGALVVLNSGGQTFNTDDRCELYTGYLQQDHEFGSYRTPPQGCKGLPSGIADAPQRSGKSGVDTATTIGVVATNAPLDPAQAVDMANLTADGDARAIRPSNMGGNGDTEYAVSTASSHAGVSSQTFANIAAVAADAYSRAIDRAILSATPVPYTAPTYCQIFKNACGPQTIAATRGSAALTSAVTHASAQSNPAAPAGLPARLIALIAFTAAAGGGGMLRLAYKWRGQSRVSG